MSPTDRGNCIKFPTTKGSCRNILTTGANCEKLNKMRGDYMNFPRNRNTTGKSIKKLIIGVSCRKLPFSRIRCRKNPTI